MDAELCPDPVPGPPAHHVALIGMMAVGKSTVGRAVAHHLGVRFVDTDEVIEDHTGRTLREIWQKGGEAAYRPLERDAVRCALAEGEPVVLATPGGVAVDDAMAAEVIAPHVTTVYLRATLDTLVRHVGAAPRHRPLLGSDPRATLGRLLADRSTRYEELADHVVDIDGRTPAGVVAAVLAAIEADGP
ncbi:MAG TPA: shikimate kinase [Iamia sp.]|nr:shikimate kinase [Iamia sp.]